MAKKLLNSTQEEWLKKNYSFMSNVELAEQLSQMVMEENLKTIERLEKLLPDITYQPTRKSVEHQIERMKNFKGFTEAYIRSVSARLECRSKSKALISQYGKDKAHDTNIKKWKKKAQKVENIAAFLRTMRVREIKICIVESEAYLNTFRNAVYRLNQGEGLMSGIEIYYEHISEANLLRLVAKVNPRA